MIPWDVLVVIVVSKVFEESPYSVRPKDDIMLGRITSPKCLASLEPFSTSCNACRQWVVIVSGSDDKYDDDDDVRGLADT